MSLNYEGCRPWGFDGRPRRDFQLLGFCSSSFFLVTRASIPVFWHQPSTGPSWKHSYIAFSPRSWLPYDWYKASHNSVCRIATSNFKSSQQVKLKVWEVRFSCLSLLLLVYSTTICDECLLYAGWWSSVTFWKEPSDVSTPTRSNSESKLRDTTWQGYPDTVPAALNRSISSAEGRNLVPCTLDIGRRMVTQLSSRLTRGWRGSTRYRLTFRGISETVKTTDWTSLISSSISRPFWQWQSWCLVR